MSCTETYVITIESMEMYIVFFKCCILRSSNVTGEHALFALFTPAGAEEKRLVVCPMATFVG